MLPRSVFRTYRIPYDGAPATAAAGMQSPVSDRFRNINTNPSGYRTVLTRANSISKRGTTDRRQTALTYSRKFASIGYRFAILGPIPILCNGVRRFKRADSELFSKLEEYRWVVCVGACLGLPRIRA